MTNETLRMQMLSGVITEGQYKAKLQENKKKKSLNESMIGGIVGIGAINQIPPRAKTDYEMAFEHFLGDKYGLKENEEMITPKTLANYIMDMIELADDMEYTLKMVDELKNLKNTLSSGSMSKEDALKVMQKTIDITGDDIDAAEALNQAISGDYKLNERETKFENREQDPHTMEEGEVNENIGNDITDFINSFPFSQEGNDELIDFANKLLDGKLSPEEFIKLVSFVNNPEEFFKLVSDPNRGKKSIAQQIHQRLKQGTASGGGIETFSSNPKALQALKSKLP
jgi:hypothetical protein